MLRNSSKRSLIIWHGKCLNQIKIKVMNRRLITDYDLLKLDKILVSATPDLLKSNLFKEFAVIILAAQVVPQRSISGRVITMNSRVRLLELTTNKEIEVTITYPQEANANERLVSVVSNIGLALIGRKLGDIVSWPIPKGIGQFEIVEVTYQPEAVGDYHL